MIWTRSHGEILKHLVADRASGKKLTAFCDMVDVPKRTIEAWYAGTNEPSRGGSGGGLQKLAETLGFSSYSSLREHIDYLFVGKARMGLSSAPADSRDFDLKNIIFDESLRRAILKQKLESLPALATCVEASRPVLPLDREKDPKPFHVFFQVSATVGLLDGKGRFTHALVYDRASYQRHEHTLGKAVSFGASYSWKIRQYVSDMDVWIALWNQDRRLASATFLASRDSPSTLLRLLAYKICFLHTSDFVIRPLGITRNDQRELKLGRSDGSTREANRVYVASSFSIGIRCEDAKDAVARYIEPHSRDRFIMRFEDLDVEPMVTFKNPDGGHNLIDVMLWNAMRGEVGLQRKKNERGTAMFAPGDCLAGGPISVAGAISPSSPADAAVDHGAPSGDVPRDP